MLIKACLNGNSRAGEHPALPLFPDELARDARSVVKAGAGALHLHPRRSDGSETFEAGDVGAAIGSVRAACPNIQVGVSTGAWIEPEVRRMVKLIKAWGSLPREDRPDFASVNLSEQGATEVCDALMEAGVGVEAGLWSREDANLLLQSDIAGSCVRLLIELVRERTSEEARATARSIERLLDEADIRTPRLLHGEGVVAWPMLKYAVERGYDVRTGLEDTLTLPDGRPARDNAQLVNAALDLAALAGRAVSSSR